MLLYEDARDLLLNGDCTCADFFKKNGYALEYGYSQILQGNLEIAEQELLTIKEDVRANWAIKLLRIIEQKVGEAPSYFQVRNFLEIDLNMLLAAKRPDYVENIINSADILFTINQESYKFIARFLYNNGFEELALYYLMQSKNKFYKDPEMHYLMANCYVKLNQTDLAKNSLKACLELVPDYLPAKKLCNKILQS